MVWFLKSRKCPVIPVLRHIPKWGPIGIDIGDDIVRIAQLGITGSGITLLAGEVKYPPEQVKSGSSIWQRWAIEAIRQATGDGRFRGREVVASLPASDVFIDHIKMPAKESGGGNGQIEDMVVSKLKQKLSSFDSAEAVIKHIRAEENIVVVMAAERKVVDRHLAIYENAALVIKSICTWPIALINSYTKFFGRRRTDLNAVVMLLEIDRQQTNVVICRHKNLLFAHSIPVGAKQLGSEDSINRLVMELTACRQRFYSMYKKVRLERLIFLSGQIPDKETCMKIARQMEMPAQLGDCLAAVQVADPAKAGIDRRDSSINWATAFGLSLS